MFKKVLHVLVAIMTIQLFRILSKYFIFMLVDRNLLSDMIFNVIFSVVVITILVLIIKNKQVNIFPKKFSKIYIIITIFTALFLVFTVFITKNYRLYGILSLIYNSILTVILEEIIFRAYIWNYFEDTNSKYISYIISTIFFGLWHIGYIDTIIWRITILNINANILNIMIWKVITGFILGIIFGFFRYKSKNVYLSMITHLLINMIGS